MAIFNSVSKVLCLLVLTAIVVAGFLTTAVAQTGISVSGRVLDENSAAIQGAQITAVKNGRASSVSTNKTGEFSLTLEPGEYSLTIVAQGFAEVTQTLRLQNTPVEPLKIILPVGGYSGTVTITDMAGYQTPAVSSATKTLTALRDLPQSVTVISREVIEEQSMQSIGDVVRYVPGITAVQGESNRDQVVIRGNNSTSDFFVDGVRDDVQYYRDLYNVDQVEALKGPNAMIFGRGGAGGVINRVTKQARFLTSRELTFQGGSYGNKRVLGDFEQLLNDAVAFRFNGMYENSGSFRNQVDLERYGLNPTITIAAGKETQIRVGYERFSDYRTADRGIPSFRGGPSDSDISTFFGDPEKSNVSAKVNIVSGVVEHQAGELNIRNRTLFSDYDKYYQNFVPGAVNTDQTQVSLSAYNNATRRRNLFNQTDLTYLLRTGGIKHTILAGAEFGHQVSDNFRNSGFFNNTSTTISVAFANPTISIPITFRQNATDADNLVVANIAATYVQDQIQLSRHVEVLAGVRFDRFDLDFHNNRNGDNFTRLDNLVSPRLGIVLKPVLPLSLYASYSVSYLPSSGDQFSSLTSITQTLKPEKFSNYEFGAKWDINRTLSLTAAGYRLDRTNTRSTDPNDPTRIVQTGSQRTNGFELGLSGSITRNWKLLGGYAYQDAYVSSATTAAPAGARVAQVPRNTFSLWNSYRLLRKLRVGIGVIHRSDMYAGIDNTVVLPGYTRFDGSLHYTINEKLGFQANLENAFNRKYFINAHSNDNISPGYPRAARFALVWKF